MPTQQAKAPDVQDLNPDFGGQLNSLLDAVRKAGGNPTVSSGYRTYQDQANIPKNNPYPVAKPGTSLHEKGLAADVTGDPHTTQLLHSMAAQFGLAFPFGNDPIHVQPTALSKYTDKPPTPGSGNPTTAQTAGPLPMKDRLNALAAMFDGGGQAPSTGAPAATSATPAAATGDSTAASTVSSPSTGPATAPGAVGSNGLSNLGSAGDADPGSSEGYAITDSGKKVGQDHGSHQQLGQSIAKQYGWDQGSAWTALNNVVMQESGWDPNAANPHSNARGIGQNINGWSNDYQAGNAQQQIQWTYNYIKSRYGTPEAAWQHEQQYNWY